MRRSKQSLLIVTSAIAALSLTLVIGANFGATAAKSTIPADGQVTAKFATDGGVTGFRTQNTIPWWGSSFTFQGQTFPFTMVGHAPSTNSSVTVPTVIIPIKFVFSPASNFGGGNFSDVRDPQTIDPGTGLTSIQGTVDSPLFNVATYPDNVGTVEFGDAIQRATFNKTGSNGYHVKLGAPSVLPVTTIDVPANVADVHSISARIDSVWFGNRLRQLINSLHISPKVVPIILTYDTVLFVGHNKANCCIVGFHGAFSSLNGNGAQQVQTFIYEAFISPGIFANPSFVDALAFSHEVSEWENDPFVNNATPPWLALGPAPFCQANLETGDVIEELHKVAFPVTLNGVTFHMQTEALLPWFTRESPSSAVAGAYSYPDTTILTTFAQSC